MISQWFGFDLMWGQKEYSNLWRWNFRLFSVRWQRNMTKPLMATGSPTRMEDWTMLWSKMMVITGHCLSEGLKLKNDPKWFYWNHHESRIIRRTMWNIDGAFAGTVWVVRKKRGALSLNFGGFNPLSSHCWLCTSHCIPRHGFQSSLFLEFYTLKQSYFFLNSRV